MPIGSRLMIRSFQSRQVIRKRTNGTKSWKRRSSAAWRADAKVAENHPLGRCSLPSRDMLELRQPPTNLEKALPRISFER